MPGGHRKGVVSFRNIDDAHYILEKATSGAKCICVGGGILGLETAGALVRRGADVTIIEGSPWLMPRQLNQRGGEILEKHVESLGVKLIKNQRVSEMVGDENVYGVTLQDGTVLEANLVITTAGVRSNSYLARLANLDVNRGVVVNNYLETSHPNILAAGDVAEHRGIVYGIWPASQYQGGIAGMNTAGLRTEFAGIPNSNTLKVLGIDVVSIGIVEPEDGSYQVFEQDSDGKYIRFVFHDSYLLGAIMIGDTSLTAAARASIDKQVDFSGLLRKSATAIDIATHLAEKTA
jgi:nitrite reductase (NADH) large subunit